MIYIYRLTDLPVPIRTSLFLVERRYFILDIASLVLLEELASQTGMYNLTSRDAYNPAGEISGGGNPDDVFASYIREV